MSAGLTCQDTDYARHIQEVLDELCGAAAPGRSRARRSRIPRVWLGSARLAACP